MSIMKGGGASNAAGTEGDGQTGRDVGEPADLRYGRGFWSMKVQQATVTRRELLLDVARLAAVGERMRKGWR